MSIPLLTYTPSTQNQRVNGFEAGSDEQPKIYSTENLLSSTDMNVLIEVAYRQIFFHAFISDREPFLESQLRNGQITVRDFVRGLLLSDTYKKSFYNLNNNYRFVEHCVQRVLGRDIYSEREKLAWGVIVASKGLQGFIDELLDSEEYLENFGYNTLPYQRRRVLPGRSKGELPFNIKSPRYNEYHRAQLGFPQIIWQNVVRSYIPQEKKIKPGDPANYLAMVQGISSAKGNPPPRVSAMNIDIASSVPYRKIETDQLVTTR
ncbi:Phycobilisome rod-core linker polypeptide,phycocyanin-associated [Richelia intracellularis HH01]|uniref:Phycobilisome rod-core linker polypeptide,phycocyanin-associated n=1 Tax=Richelia intracellularis HH01 TaxID=1165094 RepID=M1WTQ4_9NOST|nr:phycobilisome rod-core linker polypeptide [Richelia intracellularis]CCH68279.1 Phycobilisome rod-core linker polypeptide,phycocyanin-associated [Richelia intracellularis HH01]HAE05995.1 phycobilisome rod-core linker polypeptide CpcG [Richelia sp.]